jgi:hypothetical protein
MLSRIGNHIRAYGRARTSILPENLVEIRYEELVADEEATLDRVYSSLGLAMPKELVRRESKEDYIPNRHEALEPALVAKLRAIYKPFEKSGLISPDQDW